MPKFEEYPSKTAPSDNDILLIKDVAAGNTKQITRGNFIAGSALPNNAVTTASITNSAVTTAKIADGNVTGPKIAAQNQEFLSWIPSTTQALTSATFIDFGQGTATANVPTWATKARVTFSMSGSFQTTSGSDTNVRVHIGTANGASVRRASQSTSDSLDITYVDEITLSGTGSQTVKVQAMRASGTGALNIGTASRFAFIISYHP